MRGGSGRRTSAMEAGRMMLGERAASSFAKVAAPTLPLSLCPVGAVVGGRRARVGCVSF